MTLAGHVRGGTAQGIGTTLYEQYYYDADAQLLTANYADYLMPTERRWRPAHPWFTGCARNWWRKASRRY